MNINNGSKSWDRPPEVPSEPEVILPDRNSVASVTSESYLSPPLHQERTSFGLTAVSEEAEEKEIEQRADDRDRASSYAGHISSFCAEEKKSVSAPVLANPQTERDRVIAEICSTETTYIENLGLICKELCKPFKDRFSTLENSKFQDEISKVSGVLDQLPTLLGLHNQFLNQLSQAAEIEFSHSTSAAEIDSITDQSRNNPETLDSVGKVLKRYALFFRMYKQYVAHYFPATTAILQLSKCKEFEALLNEKSEIFSGNITSYLIQPVQRIPRYVLLVSALLESTPDSHPDRLVLEEALKVLQDVVSAVNEFDRTYEATSKQMALKATFKNHSKMMEPKITRILKKEGQLFKFSGNAFGTLNPRMFFLFNDSIMWATAESSPRVQDHLDLAGAELQDLSQPASSPRERRKSGSFKALDVVTRLRAKTDSSDPCAFKLFFSEGDNKGREVSLIASSPAEKQEWMAAIQASIEERKTSRTDENSKRYKPRQVDASARRGHSRFKTVEQEAKLNRQDRLNFLQENQSLKRFAKKREGDDNSSRSSSACAASPIQ